MNKLVCAGALLLAACLLGVGTTWLGPDGPGLVQATARAPAPFRARRPAPPKGDRELILGAWKVVRADANGKHQPRDVSTEQRWTITRERITIDHGDGEKGEVEYKLDPAVRPRAVDLTFNGAPWRGTTFHGIYELKGNQLKVCYTRAVGRRPTTFSVNGEADRGSVLLVLQREPAPRQARKARAKEKAANATEPTGKLRDQSPEPPDLGNLEVQWLDRPKSLKKTRVVTIRVDAGARVSRTEGSLMLPVTITNHSPAAIRTTLTHEWHGGEWPPTDLYASVTPTRAARAEPFRPVYLLGERPGKSVSLVTVPAGKSVKAKLRMDWRGTGSVHTTPFIDPSRPGTYEVRLLVVVEADGKRYAVSGPFRVELPAR
jgi:uncharacterized protein (TIGR03067 family)